MKARLCLVMLGLLILNFPATYGQTPKRNDQQAEWEYKQLSRPTDEALNYHAKQGWEIITAAAADGFYNVLLKRHKSHAQFGSPTADIPKPEPPPQNSACKLPLAQAPSIRGLRLGMTSDEVFSMFPTNEAEDFNRNQHLKAAEMAPQYGFAVLGFQPSNHPTNDRFIGIGQFTVGFFDRKVVSMQAQYSKPPQYDDIRQIMEVFIKEFNLPEFKNWQVTKERPGQSSITCDGFMVQVNAFNINIDNGSLSIFLADPTYEKTVQSRLQRDRAKRRESFKP